MRTLFNVSNNHHASDLFPQEHLVPILYYMSTNFQKKIMENRRFVSNIAWLQHMTSCATRHKDIWEVVTARMNYSKEKLSNTLPTLLNEHNRPGIDILTTTKRNLGTYFSPCKLIISIWAVTNPHVIFTFDAREFLVNLQILSSFFLFLFFLL